MASIRRDPAETMNDPYYTDDQELLANTPAQAESSLHSLEQTAGDIGSVVTSNKIEYMCFKQGDEFTLSYKLPKLTDPFTYLGSNILSSETVVHIHLLNAWIAIDRWQWYLRSL